MYGKKVKLRFLFLSFIFLIVSLCVFLIPGSFKSGALCNNETKLNKIDLIDKSKLNEKKNKFSKKIKKKVITISTFDKASITKIKSKLIKYAS